MQALRNRDTIVPREPADLGARADRRLPHRRAEQAEGARRRERGGRPLVLPLRKVQSTFPSMITVGRTDNNDLVVPDEQVSKFHAFFRLVGDRVELSDAGSRNGTFVGTRRARAARRQRAGAHRRSASPSVPSSSSSSTRAAAGSGCASSIASL